MCIAFRKARNNFISVSILYVHNIWRDIRTFDAIYRIHMHVQLVFCVDEWMNVEETNEKKNAVMPKRLAFMRRNLYIICVESKAKAKFKTTISVHTLAINATDML